MSNICLNVLIGIPASGKTTFCRQIGSGCPFVPVHVCYDSFIPIELKYDAYVAESGLFRNRRKTLLELLEKTIVCLNGNDRRERWESVRNEYYHAFGITIDVAFQDDTSRYWLLLDDNMYYRSMRQEILKLAKKHGTGYLQTFFDVSVQDALVRNGLRCIPVPEHVLKRMWMQMERPSGDAYSWEHNTVMYREPCDMEEMYRTVLRCMENPEKATIMCSVPEPMEQSAVHQLDLLLRKAVSRRMNEAKKLLNKSELPIFAAVLHKKRTNLLEDFRKGKLLLMVDNMDCIALDNLF